MEPNLNLISKICHQAWILNLHYF